MTVPTLNILELLEVWERKCHDSWPGDVYNYVPLALGDSFDISCQVRKDHCHIAANDL